MDIQNEQKDLQENTEVVAEETQAQELEELTKLKAENGILRRRLTRAEKAILEEEEQRKEEPINTPSQDDSRIERLELRADGYTPEQIDEIMKLGGKRVLDNSVVRAGIDAIREKSDTEQAASIDSTSGGSLVKGFTKSEVSNMSAKEYREKILGQ